MLDALSDDPLRHGHALLIGNSHYRDADWGQLDDIPLQLRQLKKGLKDHFDTVDVVQDCEAEQLRQKINGFVRTLGNDGDARLFIYYAGHGYTETIWGRNERRGYITGIDTPAPDGTPHAYDLARPKAISMSEIRAPLEDVLARSILCLFDSCFAGTIFTTRGNDRPRQLTPEAVARLIKKPVRYVITAGSSEQIVPAHSPIPDLFLAALKGAADRDQQGVISAVHIRIYLRDKVLQMPNIDLTPQGGNLPNPAFAEGEFLFRIIKPDEDEIRLARHPELAPQFELADDPHAREYVHAMGLDGEAAENALDASKEQAYRIKAAAERQERGVDAGAERQERGIDMATANERIFSGWDAIVAGEQKAAGDAAQAVQKEEGGGDRRVNEDKHYIPPYALPTGTRRGWA
jgi:hypothetical protein